MFLTGFNLATVVDLHMFVLSVVVGDSLLCRCMSYLCVFCVCLLCVFFCIYVHGVIHVGLHVLYMSYSYLHCSQNFFSYFNFLLGAFT